jgi:hypothetical protein
MSFMGERRGKQTRSVGLEASCTAPVSSGTRVEPNHREIGPR